MLFLQHIYQCLEIIIMVDDPLYVYINITQKSIYEHGCDYAAATIVLTQDYQ